MSEALNMCKQVKVFIGVQGEHNARVIDIDITEFTTKWPDSVISLIVMRNIDNRTYPAFAVCDGDVLHWTITQAETCSVTGGKMQIVACDANGDIIGKSFPGEWYVKRSIDGAVGEAPSPEQAWVAQVLEASSAACTAADMAENALVELRRAIAAGEFNGSDGMQGADGITPTIGENGNWYLGETDTGKPSRGAAGERGEKGDKGDTGIQGPKGDKGEPGQDGTDGVDGRNGVTPHIGENGNWYIGETDTGIPTESGGIELGAEATWEEAASEGVSLVAKVGEDVREIPIIKKNMLIDWDGNTEGLLSVEIEGLPFVRIGDVPENMDDISGAYAKLQSINGEWMEAAVLPEEVINTENLVMIMGFVFIVKTTDVINDFGFPLQFPETGVYLIEGFYASIQLYTEEQHRIPMSMLPESLFQTEKLFKKIRREDEEITWESAGYSREIYLPIKSDEENLYYQYRTHVEMGDRHHYVGTLSYTDENGQPFLQRYDFTDEYDDLYHHSTFLAPVNENYLDNPVVLYSFGNNICLKRTGGNIITEPITIYNVKIDFDVYEVPQIGYNNLPVQFIRHYEKFYNTVLCRDLNGNMIWSSIASILGNMDDIDKQQLAQIVISALPTWNGGSY